MTTGRKLAPELAEPYAKMRYQDARLLLVAMPSEGSLAPEGRAHQSIGPRFIGRARDGSAPFDPALADELYRDFAIDGAAMLAAIGTLSPGRPLRVIRAAP